MVRMRILNEMFHVSFKICPLIAENLPPSVFDLLLVAVFQVVWPLQ